MYNNKHKRISDQVQKKILKYCQTKCENCGQYIREGEFAHIISFTNGPRSYKNYYEYKNLSKKELDKKLNNNEKNALYLCPNCHKLIDGNEKYYTVNYLNKLISKRYKDDLDYYDIDIERKIYLHDIFNQIKFFFINRDFSKKCIDCITKFIIEGEYIDNYIGKLFFIIGEIYEFTSQNFFIDNNHFNNVLLNLFFQLGKKNNIANSKIIMEILRTTNEVIFLYSKECILQTNNIEETLGIIKNYVYVIILGNQSIMRRSFELMDWFLEKFRIQKEYKKYVNYYKKIGLILKISNKENDIYNMEREAIKNEKLDLNLISIFRISTEQNQCTNYLLSIKTMYYLQNLMVHKINQNIYEYEYIRQNFEKFEQNKKSINKDIPNDTES